MIKKIFIDALKYFTQLIAIVCIFITILILYIIGYIEGKKVGKWIMSFYERFKR